VPVGTISEIGSRDALGRRMRVPCVRSSLSLRPRSWMRTARRLQTGFTSVKLL